MARTKREINLCSKTINGIKFTSHEYKNGKYLITAEGYNGERWYGYDTWEKRNDGDVTDRRSSFHPENKRWFKTSFTKNIDIPSIIELFPMPLLLNAPKTDLEVVSELCWDLIEKIVIEYWEQTKEEFFDGKDAFDIIQFTYIALSELEYLEYVDNDDDRALLEDIANNFDRDLFDKTLYKKLCKLYHSDNGIYANEEIMKRINCFFGK